MTTLHHHTEQSDQLEADGTWETWPAARAGAECVTCIPFQNENRSCIIDSAAWDWRREKKLRIDGNMCLRLLICALVYSAPPHPY